MDAERRQKGEGIPLNKLDDIEVRAKLPNYLLFRAKF